MDGKYRSRPTGGTGSNESLASIIARITQDRRDKSGPYSKPAKRNLKHDKHTVNKDARSSYHGRGSNDCVSTSGLGMHISSSSGAYKSKNDNRYAGILANHNRNNSGFSFSGMTPKSSQPAGGAYRRSHFRDLEHRKRPEADTTREPTKEPTRERQAIVVDLTDDNDLFGERLGSLLSLNTAQICGTAASVVSNVPNIALNVQKQDKPELHETLLLGTEVTGQIQTKDTDSNGDGLPPLAIRPLDVTNEKVLLPSEQIVEEHSNEETSSTAAVGNKHDSRNNDKCSNGSVFNGVGYNSSGNSDSSNSDANSDNAINVGNYSTGCNSGGKCDSEQTVRDSGHGGSGNSENSEAQQSQIPGFSELPATPTNRTAGLLPALRDHNHKTFQLPTNLQERRFDIDPPITRRNSAAMSLPSPPSPTVPSETPISAQSSILDDIQLFKSIQAKHAQPIPSAKIVSHLPEPFQIGEATQWSRRKLEKSQKRKAKEQRRLGEAKRARTGRHHRERRGEEEREPFCASPPFSPPLPTQERSQPLSSSAAAANDSQPRRPFERANSPAFPLPLPLPKPLCLPRPRPTEQEVRTASSSMNSLDESQPCAPPDTDAQVLPLPQPPPHIPIDKERLIFQYTVFRTTRLPLPFDGNLVGRIIRGETFVDKNRANRCARNLMPPFGPSVARVELDYGVHDPRRDGMFFGRVYYITDEVLLVYVDREVQQFGKMDRSHFQDKPMRSTYQQLLLVPKFDVIVFRRKALDGKDGHYVVHEYDESEDDVRGSIVENVSEEGEDDYDDDDDEGNERTTNDEHQETANKGKAELKEDQAEGGTGCENEGKRTMTQEITTNDGCAFQHGMLQDADVYRTPPREQTLVNPSTAVDYGDMGKSQTESSSGDDDSGAGLPHMAPTSGILGTHFVSSHEGSYTTLREARLKAIDALAKWTRPQPPARMDALVYYRDTLQPHFEELRRELMEGNDDDEGAELSWKAVPQFRYDYKSVHVVVAKSHLEGPLDLTGAF